MAVPKFKPTIVDPSGQRAFPHIALETKMLVDYFIAKPRELVSYAAMEGLLGQAVTPGSRGYRYLCSARRILLRDHSILIDAEPKVGVKVCTDEEKIIVAERDYRKSRKAVRRSDQKLDAVDYDRLSPEQKIAWNRQKTKTSVLALMSAPHTAKAIDRAVVDSVLPTAKTLALFTK